MIAKERSPLPELLGTGKRGKIDPINELPKTQIHKQIFDKSEHMKKDEEVKETPIQSNDNSGINSHKRNKWKLKIEMNLKMI